jgi:transcription-repair coupling factor (superfamily II helicase)
LRLIAKPMGVAKIDAGPERSTLQFVKHPPFDAGALILLVQRDGRIRFAGPDRIRIERAAPTLADRVALIKNSWPPALTARLIARRRASIRIAGDPARLRS